MASMVKAGLRRWTIPITCFGSIAGVLLLYFVVGSLYLRSRHPNISLERALQTAHSVTIYPEMSAQEKARVRTAMDQGVQPMLPNRRTARLQKNTDAMFPVFTASSSFHTTAPRTPPDYQVTIFTSLGIYAVYHYSYVSATGELGSGQDWCRVTPEFRDWLRKQIANAPMDLPTVLYPQSTRPFSSPPQ